MKTIGTIALSLSLLFVTGAAKADANVVTVERVESKPLTASERKEAKRAEMLAEMAALTMQREALNRYGAHSRCGEIANGNTYGTTALERARCGQILRKVSDELNVILSRQTKLATELSRMGVYGGMGAEPKK